MTVKSLISEYTNIFTTLLKVLVLLVLCTILGAIVVYPLYKAATEFPAAYTLIVAGVFITLFLIHVFLKARSKGLFQSLMTFFRIAIVAGGLYLCIILVLGGNRLLAALIIPVILVLYGISLGISKSRAHK